MDTDSEPGDITRKKPMEIKKDLVHELIFAVSAKGGNVLLQDGGFTHAPIALLPCTFSSGLFEFGKFIAPIYNSLVDKIGRNTLVSSVSESTPPAKKQKIEEETWLESTLKSTCKADTFTNNLMQIYKESLKLRMNAPQKHQSLELGILRSDYMAHDNSKSQGTPLKLLQVELNTIAASFGSLSSIITEAHRYLFFRYPDKALSVMTGIPAEFRKDRKLLHDSIPPNPVLENMVNVFAEAHEKFKKQLKLGIHRKVAILMIVLENENNSFDQKILEYHLHEKHDIRIIRKSLREVNEEATYTNLFKKENLLVVEGFIVSVAYFRAGYSPDHYPSEAEWRARRMIEFSQAIKCPSISYHLVGTKKVQQKLSERGELEKFLLSDKCISIRRSFAKMYSLDPNEMTEEDKKIIESSKESADYVLKPQREGGGNNFYGTDVGQKLEALGDEEKKGYVLMDRIYPKSQKIHLVTDQKLKSGQGICELGMFSVILSDAKEVYTNKYAGYLLRTKFDGVDEGGVATGYSNLGSLCLC